MSRLKIAMSRRAAIAALGVAMLALLVVVPAQFQSANAEQQLPGTLGRDDRNPQPGRPAGGPPATLRIVELRSLPPASSSPRSGGVVLPFHPVGGGQNGNLPSHSSQAPLIDPRAYLSPRFVTPTITLSFDGIDSEESGGAGGPCYCVPPDGDMAAGPNHLIVGVNQAFRVYDKSGHPLTAAIGYDTFFDGCGSTGLTSSDPVLAYDPVANRFAVGILRYASSNGPSWVSLAVSRSSDPTGSYNQYCFLQNYAGQMALYDFPHISVGQTALFTTGNLYPPGGAQQVSARVNAYDKAAMYSGVMTATQVYSDVLLNSDLTQADTLRPALFNQGLPTATNYFINTSPAPSTRVTLWRWTDPFGANQFVQAGGVDVSPFLQAVPMLQPPPGQPMPPAGYIDSRTLGAMWHNGTLYAVHAMGCNPGVGVTDCVQWYQVGNLDGAPTLLQQGIVSGNTESRAYPNLAVDTNGSVRLGYAYSSLTEPLGIRHVARLITDPPNTMGPESVIKAGEQVELGFNATRWGDYSGAVTDPDGLTLWYFEEYSKNDANLFGAWGTWASAARIPFSPLTPVPTHTAAPTSTAIPPLPTLTPGGATSTPTPTRLPTSGPSQTPGGPTRTPPPTPFWSPTVPAPTVTRTPTAPATQTPGGPSATAITTAAPSATHTRTPLPTQTPGGPTATATATAIPSATSTACTISFTDVPQGSTFYTYIRCLACRGIVSGYADGTFKPNNNVTRGQLSKIVSNSAAFSDPQPNQMFEDVPVGSTFQVYIGRLASRGYISGYPCGGPGELCGPSNLPYFRPNNNATRGQIAKIDANAAGYSDPPVGQSFEDVPQGSAFYTYTQRLATRGVMGGYPCGTPPAGECVPPTNRPYFLPNNNATRGQTSKIVANTFFPDCQTPVRKK